MGLFKLKFDFLNRKNVPLASSFLLLENSLRSVSCFFSVLGLWAASPVE